MQRHSRPLFAALCCWQLVGHAIGPDGIGSHWRSASVTSASRWRSARQHAHGQGPSSMASRIFNSRCCKFPQILVLGRYVVMGESEFGSPCPEYVVASYNLCLSARESKGVQCRELEGMWFGDIFTSQWRSIQSSHWRIWRTARSSCQWQTACTASRWRPDVSAN